MSIKALNYIAESVSASQAAVHTIVPHANLTLKATDVNEKTGSSYSIYDWNAYALGGLTPAVTFTFNRNGKTGAFIQAKTRFIVGTWDTNASYADGDSPLSAEYGDVSVNVRLPAVDLIATDIGRLRGIIDATAMLLISAGADGSMNNPGTAGATFNKLLRGITNIV